MSRLLNHSDFSLLQDSESWQDPQNSKARQAFVKAMRGRAYGYDAYGYDALRDAWGWFLIGWNDEDMRDSTPVDINKHPERRPVFLPYAVSPDDLRDIWNWWNEETDLKTLFKFFEFLRLKGLVK